MSAFSSFGEVASYGLPPGHVGNLTEEEEEILRDVRSRLAEMAKDPAFRESMVENFDHELADDCASLLLPV